MSALEQSLDRFALGGAVLVGDDDERVAFVATPADRIDAAALEEVSGLARGPVVLALDDAIARRLSLSAGRPLASVPAELAFTTPIDAAHGIVGGWSNTDRARTMRVAAAADSGAGDVTSPGHVHPVRIGADDLLRGAGAAAAAIELAGHAGRARAATLCAVVDRGGAPVALVRIRHHAALGRLPVARTSELRDRLQAARTSERSVACALPTRAGAFEAIAHAPVEGGGVTLALVHGDPGAQARPFVHAHASCLFGDVLGSLLCDCRRRLEGALAAIVAAGAGVLLYAQPAPTTLPGCGRERPLDPSVAAGLLRRAGVHALRLDGTDAALAGALRAQGFNVLAAAALPAAA